MLREGGGWQEGRRTRWAVARWVWRAGVVFQTETEGYVRGMRSEGQQIQSENLTPDEERGMRVSIPHFQWRPFFDILCSEPSWWPGQVGGFLWRGCCPAGRWGMRAKVGVPP